MTKYNMSIDTARLILSALTQVKRNVTRDRNHYEYRPLCSAIDVELGAKLTYNYASITNALHELFKSWPEFSGRLHYPIGPDDDEEECERLWDARLKLRSFWDKRNAYCKARWRLLDWMIKELRAYIALRTPV